MTTTSYTADGFTASVAYPDQVVSYGYDVVGNRTSMTDRLGASSWVVDWAGGASALTALSLPILRASTYLTADPTNPGASHPPPSFR